MPSPTLAEYDSSKLDYLKKKTEFKELEKKIIAKQNRIHDIDLQLNATAPTVTDTHAEEQKNNLTSEKTKLSQELTDLNNEKTQKQTVLDITNTRLFEMQSKLAQSKTTSFDDVITSQNDIFAVNSTSSGLPATVKQPHKMSDKDIITYFKDLDKTAIDWISACPKWQHVRLMSLYDQYLENSNESDYSDEPAVPEAIVSKGDCGFYEYIQDRRFFGPLKKMFTVPSNAAVTVLDSSDPKYPTVVAYNKEIYIYVEYSKDSDYLNQQKTDKTNRVHGYIKKKNIIFKGATLNASATAQSTEDFTKDLAATSSKWLSKTRGGVTTENTAATGEDKFHINKVTADYLNPALLNDKQIYDQFKKLKDANKDCQGWIDSFLVHKSRMTKIYNTFISDYSKSVTLDGQTTASSEGYEKLDDNDHPKTLLAVITEKNANVYIEGDGGKLNRVGNLNKGNYVKISVNEDTASKKLAFEFKVWSSKKYVPIICLSQGKILFGYVNSDFVSFLTTDEESVIKKSDDTQTVSTSDKAKDELSIKVLEDTVKQQPSPGSTSAPLDPNMAKNPMLMSDADIYNNINLLNNPDKVYEWASSFPLQKKRIKEIYDKGNEMASGIQIGGKSASVSYKFDTSPPKTLMATVIRDGAHVYPANGASIQLDTPAAGNKQKIKACGELQKGAKVRLAINGGASASGGSPLFVYHKDTAGNNTRYLKIQYVDTDYSYKDGFISVNAISTYTLEQEMEEVVSSMIDQDFDSSDQDYSLPSMSGEDLVNNIKDTVLDSVGDGDFDWSTETYVGADGKKTEVDRSLGLEHNSDGSVKLDENGEPVEKDTWFNEDAYGITVSTFGLASSLVDVVFSIKAYAEKFNVQTAVNAELISIMSTTSGAVSSTLGLAESCISEKNSHAANLKIAGTVFDSLNAGFDILHMFTEKVPEYWDYIKKREGPDAETVVNDLLEILENANSVLGILSDLTAVIPIVSAAISILSSAVQFLMDLIKFINDEIQIWKMFNQKMALKAASATAKDENKEQRQEHLNSINKEVDRLQFKGAKRTDAENTSLESLLKQRAEYNDLFITTELENVNKKRRNRRVLTMSKDLLNLTGDILGLVAVTVPEPEVILGATLGKIGAKAAAGAVELGSSAARNIKQWYRDKDKNNPNNTRNKQIRYGKVAAGMINNILHLPVINDPSMHYTPAEIQAMKSRYTLVEAHINASGAKLSALKACNGDAAEMFKILYAAILKRE